VRKKYRSHVGVLLDILQAISEENEPTITRIIYRANISHDRLKKYISRLLEQGYIRKKEVNGRIIYFLTDKGVKLMRELQLVRSVFDVLGFQL